MHNTKIGIFKIAQTRVNWPEVFDWLSFIGVQQVPSAIYSAGEIGINERGQFFKGKDRTATDASALIALAGKRCYMSFEAGTGLNPNVTKIREDHAEYVTNILKSGHGSVLEHATWSFAIENVSRVFTGEMNRHRAGVAISEGSMRYIRFDDIGFTVPSSLGGAEFVGDTSQALRRDLSEPDWGGNKFLDEDALLELQKQATREKLSEAFAQMERFYIDLCNIWRIEEMTDFTQKKKLTSMFRRIVGMGVSTGGVWTINARALRHILTMRGSVHAEEEIYDVFNRIAEVMITEEPLLFGDFTKDGHGNWVPKYQKV